MHDLKEKAYGSVEDSELHQNFVGKYFARANSKSGRTVNRLVSR